MNKKQMWLYIFYGLIVCIVAVLICMATIDIISNMNPNVNLYNTIGSESITNHSEVCETECTEQASTCVELQTEPVNINTEDITENNEISEITPEVETGKSQNDCFVVYDDGRMAYIVQEGDTLSYVSTLTGCSVDELANINHIKDVNLIYAGSAIIIPR